jgi:hypothetical protein
MDRISHQPSGSTEEKKKPNFILIHGLKLWRFHCALTILIMKDELLRF